MPNLIVSNVERMTMRIEVRDCFVLTGEKA